MIMNTKTRQRIKLTVPVAWIKMITIIDNHMISCVRLLPKQNKEIAVKTTS